jgi:hypothetical protein
VTEYLTNESGISLERRLNMILIIIKLIALVIAIMYGIIIVGKLRNKQGIYGGVIVLEAIAIVVFLTIQFKLYL